MESSMCAREAHSTVSPKGNKSLTPSTMIGQTISSYKIVEQLGEGPHTVTYKAREAESDRLVTVKVFKSAIDPERKRRMIEDAEASKALDHNRIVHVTEIGSEDGVDFLVA